LSLVILIGKGLADRSNLFRLADGESRAVGGAVAEPAMLARQRHWIIALQKD
jgi:hypothetical protein